MVMFCLAARIFAFFLLDGYTLIITLAVSFDMAEIYHARKHVQTVYPQILFDGRVRACILVRSEVATVLWVSTRDTDSQYLIESLMGFDMPCVL